MRRKSDELMAIDVAIVDVAKQLRERGVEQFYGFAIAKEIQAAEGARFLTASGKLYRALERLECMNIVESEWEDPARAAEENRPRRRLYHLVGDPIVVPAQVRKTTKTQRFTLLPEAR